ncbi:MAG TPA: serine hydrolase [Chloroflexota bacterium]|jgi:CubicO group peptidase (beta-lactamase class C family)
MLLRPSQSVAAALPTSRRAPAAQTPGDSFAPLDETIRQAMTSAGIPGVAVGVLYPGGQYLAGFGVTNVESPQPVDADTLFQIGSITKTMTMAACLRLVEQGRLDLTTPIRQYVPDLRLSDPSAAAMITLQDCLTHTSGLPADHFVTMGGGDDALARFAASLDQIPFVLPPGEWASYCNTAFSLAGRVLEVARDQTYEQAIRELLLEPLGMTRSTFFAEEAILYPTAAGHTLIEDQAYLQRPWNLPRTANAAGGLVASASDVLAYASLWLNDGLAPSGERLLRPETLAQIESPQSHQPDDLGTFGLAWGLPDLSGIRLLAHDGGTAGQNARLWIEPDQGVAVCVLTNVQDGSAVLGSAAGWVVQNLLGFDVKPPATPSPLPRDGATLAAHAGVYSNPGESIYTVSVRDDGLEMIYQQDDPYFGSVVPAIPPEPTRQLVFASPTAVFATDPPGGGRGAFLPGPGGRPLGLFWGGRFYRRAG